MCMHVCGGVTVALHDTMLRGAESNAKHVQAAPYSQVHCASHGFTRYAGSSDLHASTMPLKSDVSPYTANQVFSEIAGAGAGTQATKCRNAYWCCFVM